MIPSRAVEYQALRCNSMTPMQSIQSVLGNYANFDGRARRSEYWWYILFVDVLLAALIFVSMLVSELLFVILGLFVLALLLPSLAVTARRLHDTNRSAWWILVNIIPYVGGLVLVVLCALSGTSGPNRFGPEPL